MDSKWITESLLKRAEIKRRLALEQADAIGMAAAAITTAMRHGRKVLLFGNGGSAADAQHLAAEFVGRFILDRNPLPAIALTTDTSVLTSLSNDYGYDQVFARQVQALGRFGDVAVAISTSGNSPNVLAGVEAAHANGMVTIGLTGGTGGQLAARVDIPIVAPASTAAEIQECHIAIGHLLCEIVETDLLASWTTSQVPVSADSANQRSQKVVDQDTLLQLRHRWRSSGRTTVWTNGCFDLLHLGHIRSLEAAKSLGDILVVGVNSDRTARDLKGLARPIVPESERAATLAALWCVDYVVIFDDLTPERVLASVKPDVHCKGADYAPPNGKPIPEASVVESYGGQVAFLPMLPNTSTTELIERILRAATVRDSE